MLNYGVMNFYSEADPGLLTHIVYSASDFQGRVNLVSPQEFLQVSAIELADKEEFKAHIHTWKDCDIDTTVAQEAWVVITGRVKASLYDEEQNLVGEQDLVPGDCCITLHGGHKYVSTEVSLVYEFKSGPYLGDSLDKFYLPAEGR
jgi:hypothetical protein